MMVDYERYDLAAVEQKMWEVEEIDVYDVSSTSGEGHISRLCAGVFPPQCQGREWGGERCSLSDGYEKRGSKIKRRC